MPADWQARWITTGRKAGKERLPAEYFRKSLSLRGTVKRARLYATACGVYTARINGERLPGVLAPGTTEYPRRLYYQTYDVTDLLGVHNTLSFTLMDGWYMGKLGFLGQHNRFGRQRKLLAQLEIEYTDGSREIIGTDESFSCCADGPIRYADLKDGEIYDSRMEPSYSEKAIVTKHDVIPTASALAPIAEHEHFPAKLLITPSEDLHEPLHPTYCIDRPHIIYCEKTGKYVCWIKVMASEIAQFMIVMQADRFEGPYEYVHKFYNPLKMYCGDFCLYVDEQTKKACIWYERPHFQLVCATLSDTYTEVTDEYSVHYDGLLPPYTREAPTYFERNGKKYLFTSGTSGYFPNRSDVCVFDDCHGEYTSLGDPHIGDKSETSFSFQITSVIRLPGTDRYIACADRWMPQWYIKPMAKSIQYGMQRHFKDYRPDTEPKEISSVPGELQKHNENTFRSRYVWLPIEWEGVKPVIR